MKKKLIFLFIFIPLFVFSQDEKTNINSISTKTNIPAQARYSDKFGIQEIYFNKIIDAKGRGELLEVQFSLKNKTDQPQDLYIFVIATYEIEEPPYSSFNRPYPKEKLIKSFVPFPENVPNFQYPMKDKNGQVMKDKNGKELTQFLKYPQDPKLGFDITNSVEKPLPYHLEETLIIRTRHLSRYRNNYFFFNEVTLLIFDSDGNPAFRQLYRLKGIRR